MVDEIKKIWGDIFIYKCPVTGCGKELRSLWEDQLKANIKEHKRKHE